MQLHRKILCVSGADRVKWLNDLLTIPVDTEMTIRYGALLSPQGKILTDMMVWSEQDRHFLELPESQYDVVKARLNMYKLRADVEFFDDERPVFQVEGEGDPRGAVGRRDYERDDGWTREAYDSARIVAIVPDFDVDFGPLEAYPREWRFEEMGAVDYRKGCFVGQEVVARMRHKSELLKDLRRVQGVNLMRGVEISQDDKIMGHVLTSNGSSALAFLRLKGLEPTRLCVNGAPLTLDE